MMIDGYDKLHSLFHAHSLNPSLPRMCRYCWQRKKKALEHFLRPLSFYFEGSVQPLVFVVRFFSFDLEINKTKRASVQTRD